MRKHHILIIVIIAVCIGIIISSTYSVNQYADFTKAIENEGKEFTVVGSLSKRFQIEYNPRINPNLVTFHMADRNGKEVKVVLNQSIPQDMDKSEDIVVKGRYKDSIFYASSILLKCPSKYADENRFSNPL
jgi:cytochrome c-type biogenesis protein CcmE